MSQALAKDEIATFAQAACLIEVSARKPGNVSPGRDFADTTFEDFLLSAVAIGPAFRRAAEAGVGETALAAVQATHHRVHANTNLGIALLLAPLACAAGREPPPLRAALSRVLSGLSVGDARAAYAAIRLANPGGLGRASAQDVRDDPTVTLRESMGLAAERDTIAREYVTDYDVTFRLGVPAIREARARGCSLTSAATEAYLRVLSEVPDTLIARKEGVAAARAVSDRARGVLGTGPPGSTERARAEEAFDRELRERGNRLNPGTTADLVVAALFVSLVEAR
jgi:triphosphoribosyl-dephospho-CoA synthase